MEETVGHLHDVVLGEAGDLFAVVLARVFEGVADDLFGAGAGDELEALHHVGAELILDAGVEILFVLAHDDDVHAGMLGVDERVIGDAGAHVGVEAERFAGGDVEALETAALRRGDGRFQENLGAAQGVPGAGLDAGGVAAQVDLLADLDGFDVKARAGGLQNVQGGGHDFGADAVAVRDRDGGFSGHREISRYRNAGDGATGATRLYTRRLAALLSRAR